MSTSGNTLEDSFTKLLGRAPTDTERQDLYRVRDALGIGNNDALWLVLMALEHYQKLYEKFPNAIKKAASETLTAVKATAESTARAATEGAKADLAKAVAEVAHQVAKDTAGARLWQWAAVSILAAVLAVGAVAFALSVQFEKGFEAGKDEGFRKAYATAADEKAAASWANTPDGKLALALVKRGEISKLVNCSAPGWVIDKGICYPMPEPKTGTYGWHVPEKGGQ